MGARQHPRADAYCANRAHIATVDALAIVEDVIAHRFVFKLFQRSANFLFQILPCFGQLRHYSATNFLQRLLPFQFFGNPIGLANLCLASAMDRLPQGFVRFGRLPVPRNHPSRLNEFLNGLDRNLQLLVTKQHCTEHDLFRQHFGFRLNHQHRLFSTCNHEFQFRLIKLGLGGV